MKNKEEGSSFGSGLVY